MAYAGTHGGLGYTIAEIFQKIKTPVPQIAPAASPPATGQGVTYTPYRASEITQPPATAPAPTTSTTAIAPVVPPSTSMDEVTTALKQVPKPVLYIVGGYVLARLLRII
jgi:hypothetical protein